MHIEFPVNTQPDCRTGFIQVDPDKLLFPGRLKRSFQYRVFEPGQQDVHFAVVPDLKFHLPQGGKIEVIGFFQDFPSSKKIQGIVFKDKTSKEQVAFEVLKLSYNSVCFYMPEAGGAGSSGLPAFFNGIWVST